MNLTDILHELVNEPQNEDLRKWFGKGKTGWSSCGGWDIYVSDWNNLSKLNELNIDLYNEIK